MNFKKIPERFEGRFGFVSVAATRALQLQDGARPKIKTNSSKAAQVAVTECLEDLLDWDFLVEDKRLLESQPELKQAV